MSTNILGLNNLARDLKASSAKSAAQEKSGDKSAFGEILGQAKDSPSAKPDAKSKPNIKDKPEAAPRQRVEAKAPIKAREKSDRQVKNEQPMSRLATKGEADERVNLEASALPGQPTSPNLGVPMFNERPLTNPMDLPIMGLTEQNAASMFGADQGVESLQKRAVWNDFLRKMKEELGVSAEDVVDAFSSLSIEELSQPPQQTIDKLVAALGLDPQASQMAKQFFNELITKTQPRSLGEELRSSGKQISLSMMSQREMDRKQQAGQRVENLNSQFFMKQGENKPSQGEINPLLAGLQPVDMNSADVSSDKAVADLMKNFANTQARSAKAIPVEDMAGQIELGLAGTGTTGELVNEEEELISDSAFLAPGMNGESASKTSATSGDFRSQLANANPAAGQSMRVDDLISQAEVMVRDGGGEMKVKLNPEGLGEVAMKVNVEQGKVSVQMITESDEAKSLIERQLGDLKSQLSSNNLQLETIKVDTASNLGKQLEQQYQDAQRQMAHQTLEQFRQDQQGWRRSFFEVPGVRQYKGQNEGPRDAQPPLVSPRGVGSRRLDLVA